MTRNSRWLWSGLAIAGIWICTAAMSIWSPDLVSGSQQEHLPLVALTAWVWALLATGLVLLAPAVTLSDRGRTWAAYATTIVTVWVAVAIVSIAAPTLVTGTDPTSIPIGGLIAPVVAMALTAYATVAVAAIGSREGTLGSTLDDVMRRLSGPAHRPLS